VNQSLHHAQDFLPPPAPVQTHHDARERLPGFPSAGGPRLERARKYLKESSAWIETQHQLGMAGLSVCRLVAECTDRLVKALWAETTVELSQPGPLCLVALGGYGRRELAPHSDLDLLLLRGARTALDRVQPIAEGFTKLLWDVGRTVGWSIRAPAECAQVAKEDHTIRTALLDCRFLTGDERIYRALTDRVMRDLLSHNAAQFIADKSNELQIRRRKYGDSIFLLEPDVKHGEGGLRDLQAALWIAQARFRARGIRALLKQSILSNSDAMALTAARDFLLRVRNHLHYLRGRNEDRLTFDLQRETAAFLGYRDSDDGMAVEQFMRHYYLSAKAIRRLADALIARCEEAPRRRDGADVRRLGAFKVFSGKLTLNGNPELLSREPAAILRLFRLADAESLPVHSWAERQVIDALPALQRARSEAAVVEELKALLARPGTRGDFLLPMHELGVLGTLLPEFGRLTARHQYDLYHVYTVDVHSLFALRRLYALRMGDFVDVEPELTRLMRDLQDPLPLYLGMLFHDCGKGMGGNHSRKGAELTSQVAARLALTVNQQDVARFLVQEHLLMSHTAQHRDLSDPHLISDFAARVGSLEKLICLYLLTHADICSVGPEMWTDWKARLLWELFEKARAVLLGEIRSEPESLGTARQLFGDRWERGIGVHQARQLADALPERYFATGDLSSAVLHGRLLLRARRADLISAVRHRRELGYTELALCARDRPGLLALFAGVLSAHRLDILRARITSTKDGFALDVFDVVAPQGQLLDRVRWRRARKDLHQVLAGTGTVEEVLRSRRTHSLLSRTLPPVPTKVSVDNRVSREFTVLDVRAQDAMGLLYAIASFLSREQLEITLAKISTEAHCAIDSFYLTRSGTKVTEAIEIDAITEGLRLALASFFDSTRAHA